MSRRIGGIYDQNRRGRASQILTRDMSHRISSSFSRPVSLVCPRTLPIVVEISFLHIATMMTKFATTRRSLVVRAEATTRVQRNKNVAKLQAGYLYVRSIPNGRIASADDVVVRRHISGFVDPVNKPTGGVASAPAESPLYHMHDMYQHQHHAHHPASHYIRTRTNTWSAFLRLPSAATPTRRPTQTPRSFLWELGTRPSRSPRISWRV